MGVEEWLANNPPSKRRTKPKGQKMDISSVAVEAKTRPETVDIAAYELAAVVRADVQTDYYMGLLGAIQDAAKGLGCYFAQETDAHREHPMLPQIKQCLVAAMADAKVSMDNSGLSPKKLDRLIAGQLQDGFSEQWFDRIMESLNTKGIVFRIGEGAYLKSLVDMVGELGMYPPATTAERDARLGKKLRENHPDLADLLLEEIEAVQDRPAPEPENDPANYPPPFPEIPSIKLHVS